MKVICVTVEKSQMETRAITVTDEQFDRLVMGSPLEDVIGDNTVSELFEQASENEPNLDYSVRDNEGRTIVPWG